MAEDAKTLPKWDSDDVPTYDGIGHVIVDTLHVLQPTTFKWTEHGGGGGEVVRSIPKLVRSSP